MGPLGKPSTLLKCRGCQAAYRAALEDEGECEPEQRRARSFQGFREPFNTLMSHIKSLRTPKNYLRASISRPEPEPLNRQPTKLKMALNPHHRTPINPKPPAASSLLHTLNLKPESKPLNLL